MIFFFFCVVELYKIDILACSLYGFIFNCRRWFFFLDSCLRSVKFDKSDIRRLGHEISSNGLFML